MNKNKYELILVLEQSITPGALKTKTEEIKSEVIKIIGASYENGDIEIQYCGLRGLAYKINNNKRGHYVMFKMKCLPEIIQPLNKQIRFDKSILRPNIIKVKDFDTNHLLAFDKESDAQRDREKIDYKNIPLLQKYLNPIGNISPGRLSRISRKEQSEARRAIQIARQIALLSAGV